MDRTQYLNLCKECAMMCDEGLYKVKINVPERLHVAYKGVKYYPAGYELSFNRDGSVRHVAILHDLKANSIWRVPLQEVE